MGDSSNGSGGSVARQPSTASRVAYVMSRFPKLSETFVLNEILELERQGLRVSIFPLIRHQEEVVHPAAEGLMERVRYTSYLSPEVVLENLRSALTRPRRYFGALLRGMRDNWRVPEMLFKSLMLFPKSVLIARLMERQGIEHVHAHFATHPAQAARNIQQLTDIGYSFTAHAHDIFMRPYQRTLCPKVQAARCVVVISEFNQRFLWEVCPASRRQRIEVVRCGVDLENFQPRAGERREGELRLLCVGRLTPYKGMEFLIRASALVRQRTGRSLHCRIVGEGEDRARLDQIAAECGVTERVDFLGAQPHERVIELMADSDLFVLPSYVRDDGEMEGIPVSLMEAMACGVPVVATRTSGIPELIEDGVSGLLVDPEDADSLARAITRLAAAADLRESLGRRGRERVAAEFDLTRNSARLRALFAELVG